MLPEQAIYEFIDIYQRHFNQKLSFEEGQEKALKVFSLFKTIIRPNESSSNLANGVSGQNSSQKGTK